MLTESEENFLEIVEIEKIYIDAEILNCIDLTIEEDQSFVLANGIISHNSAMGSILQKRDPKNDGVYALKGKIKNCRNIGDLSENKEIIELMQILGLDPASKNNEITGYKKIIIATDPDCLEENTLVNTQRGNIKLSDVNLYDKIDGKKILRITEKIEESYIQISIGGKIFECTEDHQFPVLRGDLIELVKAKDIRDNDLILVKNDIGQENI